jgi:iron-sulfur cluster assembly protein
MFEVTEKAVEMIKEFLKDNDDTGKIRVMMMEGGCSGPSLGMSLDELQEGDEVFEKDGVTFIIEKDLFESATPITVDFITTPNGSGFKLTSALDAEKSCGGSCCGSH